MSKQFRVFLLPSDAANLVAMLRSVIGVRVYKEISSSSKLTEITSLEGEMISAFPAKLCLAALTDARISSRFIPVRDVWIIEDESEVIEFSACKLASNILVVGRFYFQNDMLLDGSIWRKRDHFNKWADRVFRTAKCSLQYSKDLDAYVGKEAADWHASGGRFVHFLKSSQWPHTTGGVN